MTRERAIEIIRQYECNSEHCEDCEMAIKALDQQPTDADCIRRSDIGLTNFEIVMCNGDYKEALKMLLDKIEKAPSVMPQQKVGYWEWVQYDSNPNIGNWHCSECRTIIPDMPEEIDNTPIYKWCPMCGCKMQEVEG